MSKNLKKLICTLLAGAMFTTSVGLTALAADETTASDTAAVTATEAAADATEAPTEAPTEDPGAKYEDDTYYQNAIKLVSALGIITGYDDGSIKPESTVTRAEMATIVLRMLAQTGDATYQDIFSDVTSSHWAAGIIQTAVEQAILDGMGDGTFVPDGNVKYEQVLKMMVCAMNYGTDAVSAGGYPQGYVSVAGTLKLLTGVSGKVGEDMPRGEVIKAVYNALRADYRDVTGFDEYGLPEYAATETLGEAKFDLYEDEGQLNATPNISVSSGTSSKDGVVTIDATDYYCSLDLDDYIASTVKYFYTDDGLDTPTIVAVFTTSKSKEETFDADDIDSISLSAKQIKIRTSKTSSNTKIYKIADSSSLTVIYNGSLLNEAQFNSAKTDLTRYKADNSLTYDEFITPEVGSIRIVDYNSDDTYDSIFVDSYETLLVSSVTSEKLTGKIGGTTNNESVTIEYDSDDPSYKISVLKGGVEATIKNLKKNDVASLKRDIAGEKISIIVTGESITGTVSSTGTNDDNDPTVTVNSQEYEVDPVAGVIDNGVTGTFYLDNFNRVGYVELTSTLSGSEKYAMLTKAFTNDEGDFVMRLYNDSGEEIEVKPASSVKLWKFGATSSVSVTESELKALFDEDGGTASFYEVASGLPVKLCKYSLNSAGDLVKLYMATTEASTTDATKELIENGALVISKNLRSVSSSGGTVSGYTINDGITGFVVPENTSDMGSGSNYSTAAITASSYKNYDGGYDHYFVVGGFSSSSLKTAQVLVEFAVSSNDVHPITDLGTASIPNLLLVSRISEAVDDEGETVYKIDGYMSGAQTSYTTSQTTGIYKFTGFDSDQYYLGDEVFNATEDGATEFYAAVEKGDILALATDSKGITVAVVMAKAADIATAAIGKTSDLWQAPAGSAAKGSATRAHFHTGFVTDVEDGDTALITLGDLESGEISSTGSVSYDSTTAFTYAILSVEEDGTYSVEVPKGETTVPTDFSLYSTDTDEFDYALFTSIKGSMGGGLIVRVQLQ